MYLTGIFRQAQESAIIRNARGEQGVLPGGQGKDFSNLRRLQGTGQRSHRGSLQNRLPKKHGDSRRPDPGALPTRKLITGTSQLNAMLRRL